MTYRKEALVEGEYYHIYNRGNSKQNIFTDDLDRDRFTKLLYLCNSEKSINFRDDIVGKKIDAFDFNRGEELVSIGAWVLMPNHFHIYITLNDLPKSDFGNNITEFMRKLLTSYSKYFNTKYRRTGGLFESKFKSVHIETDIQAKYIFSYIHLNPIKLIDKNWKEDGIKDFQKAKKFLESYKWSSYMDYKGVVREENKILNREKFPYYFKTIKDFDDEMIEWLSFNLPKSDFGKPPKQE